MLSSRCRKQHCEPFNTVKNSIPGRIRTCNHRLRRTRQHLSVDPQHLVNNVVSNAGPTVFLDSLSHSVECGSVLHRLHLEPKWRTFWRTLVRLSVLQCSQPRLASLRNFCLLYKLSNSDDGRRDPMSTGSTGVSRAGVSRLSQTGILSMVFRRLSRRRS